MMNRSVPDWDMENDTRSFLDHLPMEYQKKPMSPNDELVELLWRNGHVVMHSQTHRKSPPIVTECKQSQKQEHSFKGGDPLGSSSDPIHEDGAGSWFQYSLEDSLEKEFCSEFFSEIPAADPICVDNLNRNAVAEESHLYFEGSAVLPPTSQQPPISGNDCVLNFSHFSRPMNAGLGFLSDKSRQVGLANGNHLGIGESSSMMTIGTSGCGSNQVQNRIDENLTLSKDEITRSAKEDIQMRSPCEGVQMNTSTSGGSGSSFGKTVLKNASEPNHKRKGRDGSESECHSEEANKPAQRSVSTRRSRSTEVHNQSERRRRDKINEKMKALQELIPHSNKSDKASMLDEAIEYLKSLQLQVQMMWMGGGMAPMMFPGVQQFTPYMGVGSPHATMHPIHNPVQLSGATPINRSIPSSSTANIPPICPLPPLNSVNFTTQMQNSFLAESYARYFAFHRMQPPLPHAMHLYAHGSQIEQQNQPAAVNSSCLPAFGPVPSGKTQNG